MTSRESLSQTITEIQELRATLAAHEEAGKAESARLKAEIDRRAKTLVVAESGFDTDKIALARTVIEVGDHRKGGADWQSCRHDAINQLATGKAKSPFSDLWTHYLGTKSYDRWYGQRSDHQYGYGPRHGGTIFRIGLTKEVRARDPKSLTPAEIEAAIYYLLNLERIRDAERSVAA